MQSHYEIRIQFTADDDQLLDVLSAYVAASELLAEITGVRTELPLVVLALASGCDRYGCLACTTPLC